MNADEEGETSARERALILREAAKIAKAMASMFAPTCEVVLHDLTQPENSLVLIENPISGRKLGDPTTEIGVLRVADPDFPDVLQNYPNSFPNGRPAKSTSVGLRDSSGRCVAALCINMDVSLLGSAQRVLEQLTATGTDAPVPETLRTRSVSEVRIALETFAASHAAEPRALGIEQRREAIRMLADSGLLQLRGGATVAADTLGISRATLYNTLNRADSKES
ncbi:PAS domain-containing protein [Sphingomonas sp.]|uniref:helix-turn-helix transcriptional regulator n=1 Tax=Sphingomonas sp. TaxID=28214 RepID=UPI00178E579D|nr:PAS domain-containing protein [Sphingomonas sp.]MBA4761188.1 PAS domain-containing protein [Sphingomonas sp.]